MVHFFLGEWDESETELLECLEIGKQTHHVHLTVYAALNLGQLYLERGDLVSARAHLQEAVTISEAMGGKTYELVSRAFLAQVASRSLELEEAAAYLRRAREIMANGEDWLGLAAEVYLAEGVLTTTQKRWEEAEAAFRKAVEINRQRHMPYYEARSLLEWGEMYLSEGRTGSSRSAINRAPTGQDWQRGLELLNQALTIFQRCAAKRDMERVSALKEQIESRLRGAIREWPLRIPMA